MAIWLVGAAGACQSDDDEQAELQALLHDEPLKQIPPGASVQPTQVAPLGSATPTGAEAASSGPPVGDWKFDDCAADHTQLFDSTMFGNTAFRAVNAACAPGVQGQGVAIANPEDIVYVPDQPNFRFEDGVTVAGWFKPTTTSGTRTLIRKRDRDTSSFALVLTGGKFQFVASFGDGRAASVTAPTKAKAGVFQHVAASYDGATLRLYLNGVEVTTFNVAGTIPVGAGPLLMGNDGSERRFNGTVDGVTFATHALTADEVLGLTCLPSPPTLVTTPASLGPAAPGVPATLDVALTNNNPIGACAPIRFQFVAFSNTLQLDPPPFMPVLTPPIASGETGHITVTATAPATAEPGSTLFLQLQVFENTTQFFDFRTVSFEVAAAQGACQVSSARELMITDLSVVDDPVRTTFDPSSMDPRNGAWTFKRLMEDMAPSAADAPAMVEAVLTSFTQTQTINGFSIAARPDMQPLILSVWPRTPDGKLDLAQAPFRLQAIVNRFDLRNLANGDAGEGRFVFAFNGPGGFPLQATMIFEYKLPAATEQDVVGWAQAFHALGAMSFGEGYNAALQAVTDRFAGRGARPGHPNGSAINAVRTNEIAFSAPWELRQFGLSATTGLLEPQTVDLTPDGRFNNTDKLAAFINANQAQIIAEAHTVPAALDGEPFAAGAIFNDLTTWFAPGVDPEARHHFALNTCNGCHSAQETGVVFLQISPRFPGSPAQLSGFLTGTTINDPVTGQPRVFNDLRRRRLDLEGVVCPSPGIARPSLRKGISRVH
ncbi:MAG TPA: LamG domain-containing protein [Kofleriaceae bacterium]|nr:LamG domain-containing protein [Kofleriaceae bacterium]